MPELRRHLLGQISRGRGDTAHWAGLALALLGRAESARGRIPSVDVVRALHDRLAKAGAPLEVGAFSIAGGLLREPAAAARMREKLLRTKWTTRPGATPRSGSAC